MAWFFDPADVCRGCVSERSFEYGWLSISYYWCCSYTDFGSELLIELGRTILIERQRERERERERES